MIEGTGSRSRVVAPAALVTAMVLVFAVGCARGGDQAEPSPEVSLVTSSARTPMASTSAPSPSPTPSTSVSTPAPSTPSWDDPTNPPFTWTSDVASHISKRLSLSVLSGIIVDAPGNTVNVWVIGDPPGWLTSYAKSRPHGVTVLVKQGKYSRRQTEDALSKLGDDPGWRKKLSWCWAAIAGDGSGLTVELPGAEPPDAATVTSLQAWLGGIDVQFSQNCTPFTPPVVKSAPAPSESSS